MSGSARSLSLTALLLVVVVVATNFGGFTQPVLTGSDRLMTQYESFRANVALDGHHDLVVLGNSVARQGVDIELLVTQLGQPHGAPLLAYNFGAGGVSAHTLPLAEKLVYGIDAPEERVIVMTPDMIAEWSKTSQEWGDMARESPYGQALADPVAWRGMIRRFLLDHVAIFGLRSALRNRLLGIPSEPREPGGYDPNFGYKQSREKGEAPRSWRKVRERFRYWVLPEEKERGAVETIRLAEAHGARVWLAEAPLQPRVVAMLPDPMGGMKAAREALGRIGALTGVPVLFLPPQLAFPASDFADARHLSADGARKYTRWLAKALSEAGFGSTRGKAGP